MKNMNVLKPAGSEGTGENTAKGWHGDSHGYDECHGTK